MRWEVVINEDCVTRLVILLQIVMVIPGKHESLSRTNESQFKKQRVQSSKCLGLSCIQTVNMKADSKTLYYSILKLTYSPPSLLKSQEKRNGHNNCYRNHSNRIIYQNIQSIFVDRMPWVNFNPWGFYASGTRNAEVSITEGKFTSAAFFCCLFLFSPFSSSLPDTQRCKDSPTFALWISCIF